MISMPNAVAASQSNTTQTIQLQPQQQQQRLLQQLPQAQSGGQQPISIALQQIPVSMLSIARTQSSTPSALTLSRGASPITISRGATPTPPASSATGSNSGNTFVAVSTSATGVLTLQNLQSIVNTSGAGCVVAAATQQLNQQAQQQQQLQTIISKAIPSTSPAPTSAPTSLATIRSAASSPIIPSPGPNASPSSSAPNTVSAVTHHALLQQQQQRVAQIAQLQQQQRMMAQIVTVASTASGASAGISSASASTSTLPTTLLTTRTLTTVSGQRIPVAVPTPSSGITIQDLQRNVVAASAAASSGPTIITAEQAAAMQRLQVAGTAVATNVAQLQQQQQLPQQTQQITNVKWNQLSSGVSTIAQTGAPPLILTKNGAVINRQQIQLSGLRQQQLSAGASSSGIGQATVVAANQPNLSQQQQALIQKQLANHRLQLATNKKINLAAISATNTTGAAVITSVNPQGDVTPIVSGVTVSAASSAAVQGHALLQQQQQTATRIDRGGELALFIKQQQQQAAARNVAAGTTTQIQLSTAQLLQAQVMSSTGQAVSVGTSGVQLAGATTLVKSVVAPQGLTGSVALTPVSGNNVSITLPGGARLAQQGIRAQRMTLTPQQQLLMLQKRAQAQMQQQVQIRKPAPGGATTIQTIPAQQLVKPVNLQGLQIIQQPGTGLQGKTQATMTVQQFQQIVAQQKAQQQQQQVLQQIISTVGTQPVGTSAGTTVTVGGTQIITSALQQQQQQQGVPNLAPTRIVSQSVAATLLAQHQQQAQQAGATVVASLSGATSIAGLQKAGQLQAVQTTQTHLNPALTQQVIAVGKPGGTSTLRPIFAPTAHLQQQRQTIVGQAATLTGTVVTGGGATVLQQQQQQRPVVLQTGSVNQGVPVSLAGIQGQQLFQAQLQTQANVKQQPGSSQGQQIQQQVQAQTAPAQQLPSQQQSQE